MIRQAHTYLAGAISGTALIGAAVVAFVLLVSLGALRDWPLAGIGGGGEDAAVSEGSSVAPSAVTPAAVTTPGATAARGGAQGDRSRQANGGAARQGVGATPAAPNAPLADSPGGNAPAADPGGSGGGSDGSAEPSSSPASSPAGAGKGDGAGSQPGASGTGGGSGQSTSGAVTNTVDETVGGVDDALGGGLGETGVTEATEKVVSGVAGPESTVGKTVDNTVKAVGGLLGGNQ
jgi:hypothetical protein